LIREKKIKIKRGKDMRKIYVSIIMAMFIASTLPVLLGNSNEAADVSWENWEQTVETDFETGTLDGLDIIDTGEGAKLQLAHENELGVWLKTDQSPSKRYCNAMAYDSVNNKIVLFGGLDTVECGDTWIYDVASNTWTEKHTGGTAGIDKPEARYAHTMAYDSINQKVVLFGGCDASQSFDDTWLYDVKIDKWMKKSQSTKPSGRKYPAMAYDSISNKVVLFGGFDTANSDETWLYDVAMNTWTQVSTSGQAGTDYPYGRDVPAMVYDSSNNKMILYGGYANVIGKAHDTWAYDVASDTWEERSTSGQIGTDKPTVYGRHSMAYDAINKKVVLFGGGDDNENVEDETWIYDYLTDTWTEVSTGGTAGTDKPSARECFSMAYDYANNKVVLFAGDDSSARTDETWIYDLLPDKWTKMKPILPALGSRFLYGMAYDSDNRVVILFGGHDGTNYKDETWAYDPGMDKWTKMREGISSGDDPLPRSNLKMVYDSANRKVVLFGGNGPDPLNPPFYKDFDDTWVYDYNTNSWTDMNPSTKPAARMDHGMTYDSEYGKVILYGGNGVSNYDETWVYDLALNNWKMMRYGATAGDDPPQLDAMGLVYDEVNKKTVLFGGQVSTPAYKDETWVYDFRTNSWTNQNPSVKPAARSYHGMVYDTFNDEIIVFGGKIATSSYKRDTWSYDLSTNTWTEKNPVDKPKSRCKFEMVFDTYHGIAILYGGQESSGYDFDTWLFNLNNYNNAGNYISGSYTFDISQYDRLSWRPDTIPDQFVQFQVAVSDDGAVWNFLGPDGSPSTYYNELTGGELYKGYEGKYVRYKAYFSIRIAGNSPELYDVAFTSESQRNLYARVTSPDGGEDWMKDDFYPITWNGEGEFSSEPVKLYYSTDNGEYWTVIKDWTTIPDYNDDIDDLWDYDFSTWSQENRDQVPNVGKPLPREGHSMVYCEFDECIYLFGGYVSGSGYSDEMWKYDVSTDGWSELPTMIPAPSPRGGHTMVYDITNEVIILFGGTDGIGSYLGDTWVYNVGAMTWTEMSATGIPGVDKPSPRAGHGMTTRVFDENAFLFGGYDGINYFQDSWEYDYITDTWTKLSLTTNPSAREGHAMVNDASNNKIILFGGFDGTHYKQDTWIYDYSLPTPDWSQRNPTTKPEARMGHAMAWKNFYSEIYLFGGYDGNIYRSDLWKYDHSTNTWAWQTPPSSGGTPSERSEHSMIYAQSPSNDLFLFGGWDSDEYMPNTGHYHWYVPNIDTADALIKVILEDEWGNTVSDTSDATFAIDPPPANYQNYESYERTGEKKGIGDDGQSMLPAAVIIPVIAVIIIGLLVFFMKLSNKRKKDQTTMKKGTGNPSGNVKNISKR